MMTNCYCGYANTFENCCKPLINSIKSVKSAEELMRSRYSAYCTQEADYLVNTTHLSTRKFHKKAAILDWSQSNNWLKLEVIVATETIVEFKAYYLNENFKATNHHERSRFKNENGTWFYVDGDFF